MDYPGAMRSRFIGYLSAAWYLLLAVLLGIGATIASNNFEAPNDRVGLMRSDNMLILFAVIHAVSNLHALKGPDVFNWYGYFYVRLGWTGSGPPAGVQMLILIRRFRIPSYVFNLQEYISVAQMLIVMGNLCSSRICCGPERRWPGGPCATTHSVRGRCSSTKCIAQ